MLPGAERHHHRQTKRTFLEIYPFCQTKSDTTLALVPCLWITSTFKILIRQEKILCRIGKSLFHELINNRFIDAQPYEVMCTSILPNPQKTKPRHSSAHTLCSSCRNQDSVADHYRGYHHQRTISVS